MLFPNRLQGFEVFSCQIVRLVLPSVGNLVKLDFFFVMDLPKLFTAAGSFLLGELGSKTFDLDCHLFLVVLKLLHLAL